MRTIKAHWADEHNFRAHPRSGRPTSVKARIIQGSITQHCRRVQCQRVFAQGPGSHYIPVSLLFTEADSEPLISGADAIGKLLQWVREDQPLDQQSYNTVIQAGDLDEATPWLNRTGWVQYLQGTPPGTVGPEYGPP
ncbi:hypothetical protein N7492_008557 [Penicillium capsulatum]|uniref:Uncharacterized protein n=1 Tax=Penicillium capsulatum TaxID=69766 RepID=A0A9W9HSX2_9EURO|nr:hypothetical protein N7492_008557 [Penicillium capsulatum]